MKIIIVIIFILVGINQTVKSQAFLLLDRRWYNPAENTDSVTRQNLSDGLFPIYKQELDTLISLINKFKDLKDDGLNRKFFYSEDFKTNHLKFEIENIKRAYGDGYEINLISTGSFGSITLKLSDPKLLLTENQKVVRGFLKYLYRIKKDLDKPTKRKKKNNDSNPLLG